MFAFVPRHDKSFIVATFTSLREMQTFCVDGERRWLLVFSTSTKYLEKDKNRINRRTYRFKR